MTPYWMTTRGEQMKPPERLHLFALAGIIANRFPYPVIINIGVSWGASLHCLVAGAPMAEHIAIDVDFEQRPIQNIHLLDGVQLHIGKSQEYEPDGDCHFVFVDGCHSYDCVIGDIENFTSYIPIGGIIAFHDFKPQLRDRRRLEGVRRAVRDMYDSGGWRLIGCAKSIVSFERVE